VLIEKPIGVQLQSEEEFMRAGERIGGTAPQPAAQHFANSVTKLLATDEVRDYSHLRNDFRLIEVARLIQFTRVPENTLDCLLHSLAIQRLPVRTRVKGICRRETGEVFCGGSSSENGRVVRERIDQYRREFRGGVEGAVKVDSSDFGDDAGHKLAHTRQVVLACRPDSGAVWPVRL